MLRIIYMGTPEFAVPPLEALIEHAAPGKVLPGGYEIVTVITRTDKPAGRGKAIVYSPVKQAAIAHGIPVWQPGSLKKPENIAKLAAYKADLYIVAAFGQILPQAVLDQPKYGTLNIHASLLPKYRGVSPISEAILQGDAETGVTIMLIDAGVDTGPILLARSIPIAEDETTGSLADKLSRLGAGALLEAIPLWIQGKIAPQPQDEQKASHTHMLRKEDGEIAWERPAAVLAREVRAYNPWPGSYTHWRGRLLKIITARAQALEPGEEVAPGTVTSRKEAGHEVLAIVTGSGFLEVERLQPEGKRAMSAEEFLRGYPQIVGEVLG
ncbi:MAG TPA: methionyl-tRNA formyltransferase [Ktedonobacteraceae bacterium]|jgi:methionyl-tRNA formyltransferase|nr:methionyl-tRNA formyltransferase [Ktedonobacteraceae bacterium]